MGTEEPFVRQLERVVIDFLIAVVLVDRPVEFQG
jgi:hypothetical protein